MKKIYLTILSTLTVCTGWAQLRLIDPLTSTDVLSSYTVYIAAGSLTHSFDFELHNNYTTSKTIKAKRYLNSYTTGQDVYFCFGTNCYSAFTTPLYAPNQSVSLAAGAMLPNGVGTYGLKTDFDNNSVIGTTQVRYTLYDMNNISDSVSLIITYQVTSVGLASIGNKNNLLANATPNPASNFVSIKYNLNSTPIAASLKLYSVMGVMVKETTVNTIEGESEFDLSDLPTGLYFYSLINNGKIIYTEKIVISR